MSDTWVASEHFGCANDSELRVHNQLKCFERQGVVARFRHAYDIPQKGESSSEESRKIDFVITRGKDIIRLQVKESEERAAAHATEHPDIPCIIVKPDATGVEIGRKLLIIFKRQLEGQKSICI